MARRNVTTSLPKRRRGDPMRSYDALPRELRRWVAGAVLPWSACSVRRIGERVLREEGEEAALRRLNRAEARMLARETGEAPLPRP